MSLVEAIIVCCVRYMLATPMRAKAMSEGWIFVFGWSLFCMIMIFLGRK